MKRKALRSAIILSVCFILWTLISMTVGTEAIGPLGSVVGLAGLNGWFHDQTGVHMALYELTDILGSIPFAVCIGFGLVGLCQLIKRKKLFAIIFIRRKDVNFGNLSFSLYQSFFKFF